METTLSTVDGSTGLTWSATAQLRIVRPHIGRPTEKDSSPRLAVGDKLEQLWTSDRGTREWRALPIALLNCLDLDSAAELYRQ